MPARAGYSRPCFDRLHAIAGALRTGQPFTAAALAERFELSRRTIVRDMEFLRDRLGYDFAYSRPDGRYVLRFAPPPVI